jgi:DNA polymerase I
MLRNFPVQAAGAEILRLAACLITEAGVQICATLHDAVLIESTAQKLENDVELAQRLMSEASRVVLFDFELQTNVSVARFPGRLFGSGGSDAWDKMMTLVHDSSSSKTGVHQRSRT